MIPKIIHFVWFNDPQNVKSYFDYKVTNELAQKCMGTWPQHLSGYEFKFWNNSHIGLWQDSEFFKKYWNEGNYAFCADYARLWILKHYGGIYLDTDVSVVTNFDSILHLKRYIGLECVPETHSDVIAIYLNDGPHAITNAILGCEPNDQFIDKCLQLTEKFDEMPDLNIPMHAIGYHIIQNCQFKIVNSIREAQHYNDTEIIPVFNAPRFDRWYAGDWMQDYGICDHAFNASWVK